MYKSSSATSEVLFDRAHTLVMSTDSKLPNNELVDQSTQQNTTIVHLEQDKQFCRDASCSPPSIQLDPAEHGLHSIVASTLSKGFDRLEHRFMQLLDRIESHSRPSSAASNANYCCISPHHAYPATLPLDYQKNKIDYDYDETSASFQRKCYSPTMIVHKPIRLENNHLSNISNQYIPMKCAPSLRTLYEQHRDVFRSLVQEDNLPQYSLNECARNNFSFQSPSKSQIRSIPLISREIQTDNINLFHQIKCSDTSATLSSMNVSTPTTSFTISPPMNLPTTVTSSVNMSLIATSDSLPLFKGRSDEKPSKFLRDFKLLAQTYVGNSDEALLRAIRPSLRDTALMWFGQLQESNQRVTTWVQFEQAFLARFRTPEKIIALRNSLTELFQEENESTADYFERLKSLITEINPQFTTDYLSRKFYKKLRLDIRHRMNLTADAPLDELLERAAQIESCLIEEQNDEKLRSIVRQKMDKRCSTRINSITAATAGYSSSSNNVTDSTEPPQCHFSLSETLAKSEKINRHNQNLANHSQFSYANDKRSYSRKAKYWCEHCRTQKHSWDYCCCNSNSHKYLGYCKHVPRSEPYTSSMIIDNTSRHGHDASSSTFSNNSENGAGRRQM